MDIQDYEAIIHDYVSDQYVKILREPCGNLSHKFIVPGAVYAYDLWDWDSWLTDVAIAQIVREKNLQDSFFAYQKGCIDNFLDKMNPDNGGVPILINSDYPVTDYSNADCNPSKPVLAQHAVFIADFNRDYSWLKDRYPQLRQYLSYYDRFCLHESGLYFFVDDCAIGVDNDPCTFYRPKRSSASIFLNCLMYKELLAMAKLAERFGYAEDREGYTAAAARLKAAVNDLCYDERNGFYYSVDINLLPVVPGPGLHCGCPRHWSTLIQRIDVWSGFLAMWSGIADAEQAARMVKENYLNERTFNAAYGVRSLSRCEKMYQVIASSNPSCWLGPVWGCVNYFVFRGLVKYGYTEEAVKLVDKTILMFGRDIEECGEMHEYYDPDTGIGVNNQGFQSWNLLCNNMIAWKNGKDPVAEF